MNSPLFIFDFDGVLVDTLDLCEQAVRQKFTELGYSFLRTRDDFLDMFEGNVFQVQRQKGVTKEHIEILLQHLHEVTLNGSIALHPGIAEALKLLMSSSSMAVISSNGTAMIEKVLARLGIAHFFSSVLGGEDGSSKVERIGTILRATGHLPHHTFYIGDTVGDMLEAKRAGVIAVGAAWGWHGRARLAKANPDYIIDHPSELGTFV